VLFGGSDAGPWIYPPVEPPRIAAMIFFPFGEEVGWRGYAQPRLQERIGALGASVVIGTFWCLWHLVMFLVSGESVGTLVAMLPFFIGGSVASAWVYNRTRGSLLLAVLAHVGAHLNNTNRALPANVTPVVIHTVAFAVAALVIVALDPSLGRSTKTA
jgi:membrane protease YdiL (CAAX protease family)